MLVSFMGGPSEPDSQKLFVSSGKIDQMITIFSRIWQRPPTAEELRGLIEDEIREQVLYREAVAMGLDKDDTIVRRRLRQKFEFLMDDVEAAATPTDRDLQDWLNKHPGKFGTPPQFSFLQVYLNDSRPGADASAEAAKLLTLLNSAGARPDASQLGDPTLLPFESPLSSTEEIAKVFGSSFAQQLSGVEVGRWSGPVRSSYGLNLVYIRERTAGKPGSLDEVRDQVRREWIQARQKKLTEAIYLNLRKKYSVVVDSGSVRGNALLPANDPKPEARNP